MTAHIDTLKEWWENAEVGDPKDGDVIIEWAGDGHAVRTFLEDERDNLYAACTYRILARAPKPKPAWHDAVAVIAHTKGWGRRRVFTRHEGISTDGNRIWSCGNLNYGSDDLIDPAPLIEAKVPDEMVERLGRHFIETSNAALPAGLARRMLTAALGLETE